jgi:uncharacterized membrane protein
MQIILVLCLLVVLGGVPLQAQEHGEMPVFRGRVVDVSIGGSQPNHEEHWETQVVKVRLSSGPHKNQTIIVLNTLTGHPFFDLRVKMGDRVLLQGDFSGSRAEYYLTDFERGSPLIAVTLLFALSVALIGGRQGIKALVSLLVVGIVIATMILPLVLKGFNPIIVTVGMSSILTMLFILFIGGYSKKTMAAISGTVGGLITSGILAFVVGKASYLTGLASGEAQMLQYMDASINFQGILFSGMIIGALGAILDVGISIASAMEQIKEADPSTDFQTLFTRGLHVGRDLIATMSNTLILAYVGSSLPLLLLFQANQSSWAQVFNLDLVASEIVRAMTGSVGLTLAIPITAFVAALLFVEPEHEGQNLSN